ncbi:hypothetical protein V1478_000143 [Vespula squamosa]|uniref:Uncharacterized protein n=1 Tax=Vespula squamosa TaxID=30214 RepID=A0ABD2C8T0_VESSQ
MKIGLIMIQLQICKLLKEKEETGNIEFETVISNSISLIVLLISKICNGFKTYYLEIIKIFDLKIPIKVIFCKILIYKIRSFAKYHIREHILNCVMCFIFQAIIRYNLKICGTELQVFGNYMRYPAKHLILSIDHAFLKESRKEEEIPEEKETTLLSVSHKL